MMEGPHGPEPLVPPEALVTLDANDPILLHIIVLTDPEDGMPTVSWRTPADPEAVYIGSAAGRLPPPDTPMWYFLDHSSTPNLTLGKRLMKIARTDGRMITAPIWFATRDIAAGERLTFSYADPDSDFD